MMHIDNMAIQIKIPKIILNPIKIIMLPIKNLDKEKINLDSSIRSLCLNREENNIDINRVIVFIPKIGNSFKEEDIRKMQEEFKKHMSGQGAEFFQQAFKNFGKNDPRMKNFEHLMKFAQAAGEIYSKVQQ